MKEICEMTIRSSPASINSGGFLYQGEAVIFLGNNQQYGTYIRQQTRELKPWMPETQEAGSGQNEMKAKWAIASRAWNSETVRHV